jgi:hypothetical protein
MFYSGTGSSYSNMIVENNVFYDTGRVALYDLARNITVKNNTFIGDSSIQPTNLPNILQRYNNGAYLGLYSYSGDKDLSTVNITNNIFMRPGGILTGANISHNIRWDYFNASDFNIFYSSSGTYHGYPNFFEDLGFRGTTPEYNYSADSIQQLFANASYYYGSVGNYADHNRELDFHPLITSPLCNGGYIGTDKVLTDAVVGTAWAGALPCVCTTNIQCQQVYGVGSACNLATKQCSGQALPPTSCSGTDTSCGSLTCANCNAQDGCYGSSYRDYYCSSANCSYTNYPGDSRCFVCTPGQTQSCSTSLLGICGAGTNTCQTNGTWGSCAQTNQLVAEICSDNLDNDCDGLTDENCQIATVPSDYISYWKFENNVNDEKGTYNGTLHGSPQYAAGVNGQGLNFNGSTDYISSTLVPISNVAAYTIAGWLKTTDSGNYMYIWSNASSLNNVLYFLLGKAADNKLYFSQRLDGSNQTYVTAKGPLLNDGNWHHVAATRDALNWAFYVDGAYIGGPTSQTGNPLIANHNRSAIGVFYSATPTGYWNGSIDELMIYNRALSLSEIQTIYNNQKPVLSAEELKINNLASILIGIQRVINLLKKLF